MEPISDGISEVTDVLLDYIRDIERAVTTSGIFREGNVAVIICSTKIFWVVLRLL